MEFNFRCDCPFTSALDILGDKWMLVIVKQMLTEDKVTFKDFVNSDEAIATNILSNKLKILEELGLIEKTQRPNNKKTNLYLLTEEGLGLAPLLVELASWSDQHLRRLHPSILDGEGMKMMRKDKTAFALFLQKNYRAKLTALKGATE